jgi:uncharacterized membrane protein
VGRVTAVLTRAKAATTGAPLGLTLLALASVFAGGELILLPVLALLAVVWIVLWVRWLRALRQRTEDQRWTPFVVLPVVAVATVLVTVAVGIEPSVAFRLSGSPMQREARSVLAGGDADHGFHLVGVLPVWRTELVDADAGCGTPAPVQFHTGDLGFRKTGYA